MFKKINPVQVTIALIALLGINDGSAAPMSTHDQVWAAEIAFAKSMADRDMTAFGRFISDEAVFFGGKSVLTGRAKVLEGWAPFFSGPPPFSWQPDQVEVLASGTLALSTGLVRDASGRAIARFNSIWRLEEGNVWRVIFDKGSPPDPAP